MIKATKLTTAAKKFQKLLAQKQEKVYVETTLIDLINENRNKWGLPISYTPNKLLKKCIELSLLKAIELLDGQNKITRYIFGTPSIFEIAVSLKPKTYISHFPALQLNGLTNQIPKTIYLTHELSKKTSLVRTLSQESIHQAFSKPQRRSERWMTYEDYKIIFLETKNVGRVGITYDGNVPITNLERTLIDATVRPNYAGGCFTVLEAFRASLDKRISLNKMVAILNTMDHIYPYHQAIGFYLERAGYKGSMIDLLKRKEMVFDFYLDYHIEEKEYDPTWRIYYPKGLPNYQTS
jgi:hypothetical protein